MKSRLLSSGASALVLALFTAGCSWFESGSGSPEDSFYRPKSKAGQSNFAGRTPGDADLNGGRAMGDGSARPSDYTAGSGLDANTYDGFGSPVPGVTFEPVYFQFDQSRIGSAEMAKINTVLNYLNGNPGHGVVVEGNCDARGSEEYNRALGERRAISAQEQILAAGIAPRRVKTISNGKSKPAASGEDEASYQLNRRDDFIAVKLLNP